MRNILLTAFFSLSLLAAGQRSLVIRGQVHAAGDNARPCNVMLLTACGDTLVREDLSDGQFSYRVPRNARYILRFEEPSSVTKEMVVDASELPRVQRMHAVRRIEFDVTMEHGDPAQQWRYSEPLGFTSLKRGSTMRVFYDPVEEAAVDQR